jgi:hypothetical protein
MHCPGLDFPLLKCPLLLFAKMSRQFAGSVRLLYDAIWLGEQERERFYHQNPSPADIIKGPWPCQREEISTEPVDIDLSWFSGALYFAMISIEYHGDQVLSSPLSLSAEGHLFINRKVYGFFNELTQCRHPMRRYNSPNRVSYCIDFGLDGSLSRAQPSGEIGVNRGELMLRVQSSLPDSEATIWLYSCRILRVNNNRAELVDGVDMLPEQLQFPPPVIQQQYLQPDYIVFHGGSSSSSDSEDEE